MRIAITGAGGLIGRALSERLTRDGHEVLSIGRHRASNPPDIRWSVERGQLNGMALEGTDAVVHLAGEPIFGKWTHDKKRAILSSRVDGTRLLAATLAGLYRKPEVLISMSAVGYYGSRGDELLTESSGQGEGFLADVCAKWEAAAEPARDAGIRVVHPRLGLVLSPKGGALKMMLPAFKLGLGGRISDGKHWMSWITLDDTINAICHLIAESKADGPVNLVAPKPNTNKQYTRALAAVLKRPAIFPVPAFALRMAMGELADEALLASQRCEPIALTESGYLHTHHEIKSALQDLLKRKA